MDTSNRNCTLLFITHHIDVLESNKKTRIKRAGIIKRNILFRVKFAILIFIYFASSNKADMTLFYLVAVNQSKYEPQICEIKWLKFLSLETSFLEFQKYTIVHFMENKEKKGGFWGKTLHLYLQFLRSQHI